MCGLTGFCDFNGRLTKEHLNAATDVLNHRGPDKGGALFFGYPNVNIGLGHRRLSILDVSSNGDQPMYNDDKSIAIVFNGEIYNFKEIRKELETMGYSFHSDSDTEVILKAYQQYGINAAHKFIGMFAFVIYDMKNKEVYLLRDRAGVKPLYYFYKNNCLLFASELKSFFKYPAFEKNINQQAVSLFFKYAYIRAPHTIFADTYKVTPGHYIRIDIERKELENIKYYDVIELYNKPKIQISEQEAVTELESLFSSAFQYRMVSDVPVGLFLSGGYDSSLVAGVLQNSNTQKIKTFTIGFNEAKFNEAPYAKEISKHLGTNHYEYYCTTKDAQDILPTLADIYDEPFGDSSAIPTILLSRFARKHVKVSLSADGGDEIFAGYDRYPYLNNINRFIVNCPDALLRVAKSVSNLALKYLPDSKTKSRFERLRDILKDSSNDNLADVYSQHYNIVELHGLLNGSYSNIGLYDNLGGLNNTNDFINTCLALDYCSYMVDNVLVKVDRATMSVGLEGREPLLDHRIIEFVSQLPSDMKYHKGEKKYLIKKIAHKQLPKALLNRPKAGFAVPLHDWFRNDLRDYLYEYINEEQLAKHDLLDSKKAIRTRDQFLAGQGSKITQIWLLIVFQLWWNRWM